MQDPDSLFPVVFLDLAGNPRPLRKRKRVVENGDVESVCSCMGWYLLGGQGGDHLVAGVLKQRNLRLEQPGILFRAEKKPGWISLGIGEHRFLKNNAFLK